MTAASTFNLSDINDIKSKSRHSKNLNFIANNEKISHKTVDYVPFSSPMSQEFQHTIAAFKHFTGPHPAFFHIDLICNIYFTFELVC